jgi:membrane protein
MRLWLKKPLQVLAKVRLPGWRRVRLGSVAAIFWESITHPSFTLRAGAMAFSFFFALFPGLIFTTTIFSYLPFEKIEVLLQQELGALLPQPVYQLIHDVVFEDIYKRRNITLLSTSLFLALYSSWQGMLTLLRAFYQEGLPQEKFWVLWLKALGLLFFLVLVLASGVVFALLRDSHLVRWLEAATTARLGVTAEILISLTKGFVLLLIATVAIEVIYRAALPRRSMPYWLSPGSVTATLLMGAAVKLLSWYFLAVANFSRFYGSIAAVIALMIFFYWVSIVLLVGFTINYSLYRSYYLNPPTTPG